MADSEEVMAARLYLERCLRQIVGSFPDGTKGCIVVFRPGEEGEILSVIGCSSAVPATTLRAVEKLTESPIVAVNLMDPVVG